MGEAPEAIQLDRRASTEIDAARGRPSRPHRLPHPDDPRRRRGRRRGGRASRQRFPDLEWPRLRRYLLRHDRTARTRSRRWPASATSCWSSARRTRRTRGASSRSPNARAAAARLLDDETEIDPAWLVGARTIGRHRRGLGPRRPGGSGGQRARRPRSRRPCEERPVGGRDVQFTLPAGASMKRRVASCGGRSGSDRDDERVACASRPGWGRTCCKQKLRGRERFPLIVELEPLFACNLACAGCGKIQYPPRRAAAAHAGATAVAAIEECGAPMVSIAGGEPLIHPEIDRDRPPSCSRRKKFVYLCTNALLLREEDRPVQAVALLLVGGAPRRPARAPRRARCAARACSTWPSRACGGQGGGVPGDDQLHLLHLTTRRRSSQAVLDFLNDELKVDAMMISPAYGVREGARPGALPGGRRRRGALFAEAFAGGAPQALAPEPLAAVPRLPRGQDRLRVHAVGYPVLLDLRLAAALLPAGRRLLRDVPRAGGDHRLVEVRPAGGDPQCRELHGPLRLRAVRRARDHGLAQGIDPGDGRHRLTAREPVDRQAPRLSRPPPSPVADARNAFRKAFGSIPCSRRSRTPIPRPSYRIPSRMCSAPM